MMQVHSSVFASGPQSLAVLAVSIQLVGLYDVGLFLGSSEDGTSVVVVAFFCGDYV